MSVRRDPFAGQVRPGPACPLRWESFRPEDTAVADMAVDLVVQVVPPRTLTVDADEVLATRGRFPLWPNTTGGRELASLYAQFGERALVDVPWRIVAALWTAWR